MCRSAIGPWSSFRRKTRESNSSASCAACPMVRPTTSTYPAPTIPRLLFLPLTAAPVASPSAALHCALTASIIIISFLMHE